MKTSILLDHDAPAADGSLHVRALLRIEGEPPLAGSRTPLNLSVVLDRSSSMGGEKIVAAREAAGLLVRRLWPEDVVSVVAYDHDVTVVSPPARGSEAPDLSHHIGMIRTRGTTNLSGGWLKGRELVAQRRIEGGMNRVILLTDGQANRGITDRDALAGLARSAADQGITTTTVGFGEGFDEVLLRAMADAGGGNSYYIERPDQAAPIFEEEMAGLLSLSAQNLTVEVRPAGDAELVGVRHSYPSHREEGVVRVQVGDLYSREPRNLLVDFLLAGPPGADELELGTLVVRGDVLTPGGGVEHREISCALRMTGGEGPRVEEVVRREMLLVDTARARDEALRREEAGDFAGAAGVLRKAAEAIRALGFDEDERLGDEARDLEGMAARADRGPMTPLDRKYLHQRSHEAARSKPNAFLRIRRKFDDLED
jgi:Ca-activated chloride channel homolog